MEDSRRGLSTCVLLGTMATLSPKLLAASIIMCIAFQLDCDGKRVLLRTETYGNLLFKTSFELDCCIIIFQSDNSSDRSTEGIRPTD